MPSWKAFELVKVELSIPASSQTALMRTTSALNMVDQVLFWRYVRAPGEGAVHYLERILGKLVKKLTLALLMFSEMSECIRGVCFADIWSCLSVFILSVLL